MSARVNYAHFCERNRNLHIKMSNKKGIKKLIITVTHDTIQRYSTKNESLWAGKAAQSCCYATK